MWYYGIMPAIRKPIVIKEVVPIRREDLPRLYEPRTVVGRPKKLRHSHHQVATLDAMGMEIGDICQVTGYSTTRIMTLRADPAYQMLVAQFRERIDDGLIEKAKDAMGVKLELMTIADRQIRDIIEEKEDEGETLSFRDALKLSTEMSDRVGYGKHTTNTNYNVNYATSLEERIRRRNQTPPVAETLPPQAERSAVVPLQLIKRRLGE